MDDINIYMMKKINNHYNTGNLNDETKTIIKEIIYNIKSALSTSKNIYKKVINTRKSYFFNYSNMHLLFSKYMPSNIKKEITKNKIIINYRFCNMNINFICNNSQNNYNEYILKILNVIYFLSNYTSKNKSITINLCLTNNKKIINNYIQEPENINSGLCMNNEILIFRKEEWFKVLIHELIHCFKLDFSFMNTNNFEKKIKKEFNLKNVDLNLFECYTEFWANIINICFYVLRNYKMNLISKINDFIKLETLYSILIMNNILIKQDMLYSDFFIKNDYRENTNVFCYYILKSIMLYNKNIFLEWCNTNKNILIFNNFKIDEFINLLIKQSKSINNIVNNLDNILLDLYKSENEYDILNTTKMTLLDN